MVFFLSHCSLSHNSDIKGEGAAVLARAVIKSASIVDFSGVPVRSLKSDGVEGGLGLSNKGLGDAEALVLGNLLKNTTKVTRI